jgi:FlaA1/EpsC-like NDP-sugar epimerase
MFTKIISLPRKIKIFFMLVCDTVLLPLAFWSAVALRLGSASFDIQPFLYVFLAVPFLTIPIFIKIGLYRAVIRYLDDKIIYTILFGVTLSVLCIATFVAIGRFTQLPRSSIGIYWFMAISYIATSRYLARGIIRRIETYKKGRREAVAIYGAGQVGLQTALTLYVGKKYKPVAFFDDDIQLHGSTVAGLIVYSPERANEILIHNECKQLLLAMPHATRAKKAEIIKRFEGLDIELKTVPAINELIDGHIRIEDIREVGIEDLLGRDPVPPISELISGSVTGKNILVTGAGGSIGSELCRQIIKLNPIKLVLLDMSEYNLYKLDQELSKISFKCDLIPVLGNITDENQVEQIFKQHDIHTIYHAAAFKHVPLVEQNVVAAVQNNVFGTLILARLASKYNIEKLILVSTDKAVRPTNIMGATKRLAELVLQSYAKKKSVHSPGQIEKVMTNFCMVRFGNVLGSSGSVVPLFKEQIKQGGPITVTHPDVTRFFMTIPEAAQLVLQAASLAVSGDVFVLDMGEPIKIVDLAKKMIELSGLKVIDKKTELGDIAISFTGLRPGEKLYEELLIGNNSEWTKHPRIMKAQENYLEFEYLHQQLSVLKELCNSDYKDNRIEQIKEHIKLLVPEFVFKNSSFKKVE